MFPKNGTIFTQTLLEAGLVVFGEMVEAMPIVILLDLFVHFILNLVFAVGMVLEMLSEEHDELLGKGQHFFVAF
jgi:hypothetical protein